MSVLADYPSMRIHIDSEVDYERGHLQIVLGVLNEEYDRSKRAAFAFARNFDDPVHGELFKESYANQLSYQGELLKSIDQIEERWNT